MIIRPRRSAPWAFLALVSLILAAAFPSLAAPSPGDVSALLQSAQHQFNAGNYSSAISTLLSAVSQNPSSAEAYYWLGRSYYEVRDYDSAVTQAEKSVSLDPKNSLYHQWLGRIYGGKADRDRSFFLAKRVKKEFQTAVTLDPSNLQARRDLEEFCLDAPWIVGGSKDEARQQMDAIAAADPVSGYLARAVFDRADKNSAAVEKDLQQVLDAKPSRIEPYLEVADYYAGQSKPAQVDAAIRAASLVNSKDPRLTFYQGMQRVLAGADFNNAEIDLKSYLATTPDRSDWPSHAAAREWLGRLYEVEGKRADAAEQYRAALRLDPGRKDVEARLAHLEKEMR
ncbi:MAG TPA: tetratricopeptide repeat protein [Candidatus Acidoferrales bacterium]|nr:tetratricopeptide repeat protein [Candidatus Acidoferrales bacterium]